MRIKKEYKNSSNRSLGDIAKLHQELTILSNLDHPNIVKVYGYYEDTKQIYIVTELCEGGELFEYLTSRGKLSEKECAIIMKQVLSALAYCHSKNIVHRDLKPENILFLKKGDFSAGIKVIDFGTSTVFDPTQTIQGQEGTPYYVAPEVLKKSYNYQCDVWSAGIILYTILCGYPPFTGKTKEEILAKVSKGKYTMVGEEWKDVSKPAKDLVIKMLMLDPKKRITASNAINDVWIAKMTEIGKMELIKDLGNTIENLKKFKAETKLKQATMIYIMSHLVGDKSNLQKAFIDLDKNGDGRLSKDELLIGYKAIYGSRITAEEIARIFDSIDIDHSGTIDYHEFLVAAANEKTLLSEANIKLAFDMIDKVREI